MLLNAYEQDGFADEKRTKYDLLRHRYLTLTDCFDRMERLNERFERLPSNAGYFLCVRPLEVDADALRLRLLKTYDVGVISTSGLIRIAFSSTPSHALPTLADALVNAYDDLYASAET